MNLISMTAGILVMSFLSISSEAKSLAAQLEAKARASGNSSPAETKKVMNDAITELRNSEIMKTAKKNGDTMPAFSLKDIKQGPVTSKQLLKKGPLIVTFYRGGWCPYCNLQLRDLQLHLKEINQAGAQLVAISPEAPDRTAETVKKSSLEFYVLSDIDGTVAKSFGITYKLPDSLKAVYTKFGIDLSKENATKSWELPVAATYIVNKNGIIIYSYVEADYKKRAETTELVKILKSL